MSDFEFYHIHEVEDNGVQYVGELDIPIEGIEGFLTSGNDFARSIIKFVRIFPDTIFDSDAKFFCPGRVLKLTRGKKHHTFIEVSVG